MTVHEAPATPLDLPDRQEHLAGRTPSGSFLLAALVGAVSAYLSWGALTMEVPATASSPGPLFFPTIVIGLGYGLALALVVRGWRQRRSAEEPVEGDPRRWSALALAVGTLAAFVIILEPVGWLISGALLFAGLSTSLGSRRPVFDLTIAVLVSSVVQLVFSAGLGLYLPVGIMGVF